MDLGKEVGLPLTDFAAAILGHLVVVILFLIND
jgi:hypothetical protein